MTTRTRGWHASTIILAGLGLALSGCGRANPLPPATDGESAASVRLALGATPAEVKCVVVTVSAAKTERRVLEPAPGVIALGRFAVGVTVFSVEAFAAACANLSATSVPSWLGGPESVLLKPGENAVFIAMRPVGTATVTLDFDGGQMCAPEGSACVTDKDCCSSAGRCAFASDPGLPAGVGRCGPGDGGTGGAEAPTADPKNQIGLDLDSQQPYVLYPPAKTAGCEMLGNRAVTVRVTQKTCVPPQFLSHVVLAIEDLQLCTSAGGCQMCSGSSCLPGACFKELQLAAAGSNSCPRDLVPSSPGTETHYLLLAKDPVSKEPKSDLPMVIWVESNGTIPFGENNLNLEPQDATASVVVARTKRTSNPTDMCDEGFCGTFPLKAASTFNFSPWSWAVRPVSAGSGIRFWTLY
jgi:hypothetical protein